MSAAAVAVFVVAAFSTIIAVSAVFAAFVFFALTPTYRPSVLPTVPCLHQKAVASYSAAVDILRGTEGGIDSMEGVAAEDMAAMQALLEEDERSPSTFAMAEDESLDYDVGAVFSEILVPMLCCTSLWHRRPLSRIAGWICVHVCVLRVKPLFLSADIQYVQCPCRFFLLERCKTSSVVTSCGHDA